MDPTEEGSIAALCRREGIAKVEEIPSTEPSACRTSFVGTMRLAFSNRRHVPSCRSPLKRVLAAHRYGRRRQLSSETHILATWLALSGSMDVASTANIDSEWRFPRCSSRLTVLFNIADKESSTPTASFWRAHSVDQHLVLDNVWKEITERAAAGVDQQVMDIDGSPIDIANCTDVRAMRLGV